MSSNHESDSQFKTLDSRCVDIQQTYVASGKQSSPTSRY